MPKGDRNCINPFAMAAVKVETVIYVDHVPKNISSVCCLYSLQSESIVCHAMGPRRHCKEVPCAVIFDGRTQHTKKGPAEVVEKLVKCVRKLIKFKSSHKNLYFHHG